MKKTEVTISAKMSADYQTASRSETFEIEEDDDPIVVMRELKEHRDALQQEVKKDLDALLRKSD